MSCSHVNSQAGDTNNGSLVVCVMCHSAPHYSSDPRHCVTSSVTYLELRVLVVLELEWFSSSESDSRVLTDSFLGMG